MWEVIRNWCDCHPETCCCDPYKIFNTVNPKLYFTKYNKEDAVHLADDLNKNGEWNKIDEAEGKSLRSIYLKKLFTNKGLNIKRKGEHS